MRSFFGALVALAVLAGPVESQQVRVDSLQLERTRTEAVRSRGFLRGAETQLTKTIALIDSLLASGVPVDTTVTPPPVDTIVPPPVDTLPPPPSGPVDWFSDWAGRGGNSYDALHDGGKWTGNLCSDTHLANIVDSSGRDFPSTMGKVYRYEIPNSNECYLLEARNQWAMPNVGEYQFIRYYMRFEAPTGHAPQQQHFFHQGDNPQGQVYESTFWLDGMEGCQGVCADGRYRVQLINDWFGSDPSWHNIYLRTYQTYRVELRMFRETTNTARYSVRVFDSSGAELGPENFFFEYYGPQQATTLEERVQNVRWPSTHWRIMQVGYNGSSPTGNFSGGVFNFIGGVAVKNTPDADGWIGPYSITGGE